MTALEAVVFDFDGLILDTEWAIFESARTAFETYGHSLSVEAWSTIIGTNNDGDGVWWGRVCEAAGVRDFDLAHFELAYEAQDRSSRDHLPALPGVVDLVEDLVSARVPLGIASSSSRAWLDRHIGRLGLGAHFTTLVGADVVGGVGKPAPDVYLRACADLDADPTRSVALEDSAHGATAAKAAGMTVVAVPSRITRFNDFAHADLVVETLHDVTVDRLQALTNQRL
ncbi:MAG: HAD family phosphatase [Acidimicrobiales bacterium]